MCDDWMPLITLPLTHEQFHQLPRNAAYRYEFLENQCFLSPRPKHYHALLDLRSVPPSDHAGHVRTLLEDDFAGLVRVFSNVFRTIQPYGSLDDVTRVQASHQALERTRSGGDGPLIASASFVASQDKELVGAILITLLPLGDPCDWDSYHWKEQPPADSITRRLGRPHLTWIFVSPITAGQGIGTSLLSAAARELQALGYTELLSTFMLGNDSSMLWHWRNGFRLLAHPGSHRLMRDRLQARQS
ncbi:MAG TPA: GNAT family N-acetyltransferase [Gemmataceae bacterium]|nr:GNAT family N-acetyltransferase [Gemmataceae bacterium]